MIWALFGIYLFVCVIWFFLSWDEWDVSKRFPTLYTEEEISYNAKRVLHTPIWPLWALKWVGETIAKLQRDVMK